MTTLKIGEKAPDFSGTDQYGNPVKLSDFTGKKVVLFFYPKALTPGCTAQACNLNEHQELLSEKTYQIIGVSADSQERQLRFAEKYHLNFPLLADENKTIIEAYNVWGPKKFMGKTYDGIHRTTFVIDANGTIENIITKVKTKEHHIQILQE